ncbi:hypothetical protein [Tenacibaculum jejuense]|uniref:Uncharacterized protein n=1 Tax=Tenacibaculum jejuense TaxID=584609 RepID=A0A238U5T0_9FLAO|nr:hypothetical protein [Tenacibaculum jejuense]SNR14559.1 conserved membrane protein of unknown function [Tenacibaculum jejuense]
MKAFRNLISITIYLFFTVGILAISRVVVEEIKTGNACPKVQQIPVCYVMLSCFVTALTVHILNKKHYLYFITIGFAFLAATLASIMHIKGEFVCPKTIIRGTPKCYYAVGLLFSLLSLKAIHIRDIEKDFIKK